MADEAPRIAVFGASGLIGGALATGLTQQGFEVVTVARRFTRAQKASYPELVECAVTELGPAGLGRLLIERGINIVVNCIGVLQEGADARQRVDQQLVADLLTALASVPGGILVHVSVPGRTEDDRTAFSRSKRQTEALIEAGEVPYVILRPGFVIAPNAYGGSALIRGLAALPFGLPEAVADRPFAATAIADLVATVAFIANRRAMGERLAANWDVMERQPGRVGDIVAQFRRHFGGPGAWFALPNWLLLAGTRLGDFAGALGWSPPIRTTALAEMQRGIEGDSAPWADATGIEPKSAQQALAAAPASIQESWFSRMFLLKPLIFAGLSAFWIISGLVSLIVSFDKAAAMLAAAGVPALLVPFLTTITGLADVAVGIGIAYRKTTGRALVAGIALSLLYLASATILTPSLWLDPLGTLVKDGPAIILMLVALAIIEAR